MRRGGRGRDSDPYHRKREEETLDLGSQRRGGDILSTHWNTLSKGKSPESKGDIIYSPNLNPVLSIESQGLPTPPLDTCEWTFHIEFVDYRCDSVQNDLSIHVQSCTINDVENLTKGQPIYLTKFRVGKTSHSTKNHTLRD